MYSWDKTRKYQKEYSDYVRSIKDGEVPCTYYNFAKRMRYEKSKKVNEIKKSPKRLYDTQYTSYCQTTTNPVPYAVFSNRLKSKKYRMKIARIKEAKRFENKNVARPNFITVTIEHTPKIKREFRTPVRFDVVLDFVARVLLIWLITSYRVPVFM